MLTAFSVDPRTSAKYRLEGEPPKAHGHLHYLPDAQRIYIEGGPRHLHPYDLSFQELVIDANRTWIDDQVPNRVPKLRQGFVYAASYEGQGSLVKIGRTAKLPEERLAILTRRTSAPGFLRLLFAIQTPMMTDVEGALHRAFNHRRQKGEWFLLSPEALLSAVLGAAAAHRALRAECRVWMSNLPLLTATPNDMRLLRKAGLGKDAEDDERLITRA